WVRSVAAKDCCPHPAAQRNHKGETQFANQAQQIYAYDLAGPHQKAIQRANSVSHPLESIPKIHTGIAGLDKLVDGGLPQGRLYLVQGESGAGKTTLGLQFLLAGVQAGEAVLYITLSETEYEIRGVAASHGWSLAGVHIHELVAIQDV